jgi:hypothetical protein
LLAKIDLEFRSVQLLVVVGAVGLNFLAQELLALSLMTGVDSMCGELMALGVDGPLADFLTAALPADFPADLTFLDHASISCCCRRSLGET